MVQIQTKKLQQFDAALCPTVRCYQSTEVSSTYSQQFLLYIIIEHASYQEIVDMDVAQIEMRMYWCQIESNTTMLDSSSMNLNVVF